MGSAAKIMFIFPGQGSQYKGIGSDIYEQYDCARAVYQKANTVLGYDITDLSFNGPSEKINLTRYTQPVLLTHSIACLAVFRELTGNTINPAITAGHSLGEYSALVAAGALDFDSALRLVQQRAEAMGEYGTGEMLALPFDLASAQALAEQHYCAVAGCNLAEQTVVGGLAQDLDALTETINERFPRKRTIRLKTEGAFHTFYMVAAAQHYRQALAVADINMNDVQVLSNYTGNYHNPDAASVKINLFFQLFYPVLWLRNLHQAMADGVTKIIEFGGGLGAGETPADKRPNLESIVKKSQRGSDYQVEYSAAINSATLVASAAQFNAE